MLRPCPLPKDKSTEATYSRTTPLRTNPLNSNPNPNHRTLNIPHHPGEFAAWVVAGLVFAVMVVGMIIKHSPTNPVTQRLPLHQHPRLRRGVSAHQQGAPARQGAPAHQGASEDIELSTRTQTQGVIPPVHQP